MSDSRRKPRRKRRPFVDYRSTANQDRRLPREKGDPVTICIAAMCDFIAPSQDDPNSGSAGVIVGATDRMITAGNIEFEARTRKHYLFSRTIVALIAGDTSAQDEICCNTQNSVNAVLAKRSISVGEAAQLYCDEVASFNLRQSENTILAPYGLKMADFVSGSRVDPDLACSLAERIERNRAGIHTIIAGMDSEGPHLYTVDKYGCATRHDSAACTAIGYGEWHAESQFIFERYNRSWSFAKALLLTYTAKKRAEAAPGVGRETDLFVIAPSGYHLVPDEVHDSIEGIYNKMLDATEKVVSTASQEADDYIASLFQTASEPQPSAARATKGRKKRN